MKPDSPQAMSRLEFDPSGLNILVWGPDYHLAHCQSYGAIIKANSCHGYVKGGHKPPHAIPFNRFDPTIQTTQTVDIRIVDWSVDGQIEIDRQMNRLKFILSA